MPSVEICVTIGSIFGPKDVALSWSARSRSCSVQSRDVRQAGVDIFTIQADIGCGIWRIGCILCVQDGRLQVSGMVAVRKTAVAIAGVIKIAILVIIPELIALVPDNGIDNFLGLFPEHCLILVLEGLDDPNFIVLVELIAVNGSVDKVGVVPPQVLHKRALIRNLIVRHQDILYLHQGYRR